MYHIGKDWQTKQVSANLAMDSEGSENMSMTLSERKKRILKAIIKAYVETGEPVGSKFLAQDEEIAASSATIRNEMAELTEMGYLMQPHTSAGRIPSEQGYRFYVDSLMEGYNAATEEIGNLNELLKIRTEQLDRIIDDAGRLASALTNYPAISVKSNKRRQFVKRFSVMQNSPCSFLLIMLIGRDTVKTKTVTTRILLEEAKLTALQAVLNDALAEKDLETLTFTTMMNIEKALGDYAFLASPVMKSIYEALSEDTESDVHVEGVDRLLSYPEFSDMDKLKSLLGLFNRKEELVSLVEDAHESGVNVLIGSESTVDTMNGSTFIFKTIKVDGVDVGAIGIIGPCRMDYEKVISTIDTLTSSVTEMMGKAAGRLPNSEQKALGSGETLPADPGGEGKKKETPPPDGTA